ncbi:MAG TPA: cupin domain-containing protein [Devosiaceae bacterium]|jgi:quercetin dioxygenase-like cupin family protein|nr:cupin domain-containing protein [Devosiaceae bacterium]
MIDKAAWADLEERTVIPGFHGRFLHSGRMTFVLWRLDAGAVLPAHAHPHEQVVHVLAGELEMTLEGETTSCGPGTVLVIPPDAPHSGRVLTDASVMDVFSPVREDYRDGGEMLLAQALEG